MQLLHLANNFKLTPQQVAQLFCSMDNEEMAAFFNEVAKDVATWNSDFCFQMQSLTDTKELSDAARGIMAQIGNYAPKPVTL